MPTFVPPKKNDANGFTFYVSLVSQADTKLFQASPTLAAGDVRISIDDGAPANLTTLPVVDADFTKRVKVVLSQAETNGDNLSVIFSDAAGAEWCDLTVNLQTVARQVDDLAFPAVSGRSVQVETDGMVHADIKEWLGVVMNALIAGRVDASAGAMATDVLTAAALSAAGANKLADHIIRRTFANARTSADGDAVAFRSLLGAIAKLVNKWDIAGSTLTIRQEDDTTALGTQAITATAGADPITQLDTV